MSMENPCRSWEDQAGAPSLTDPGIDPGTRPAARYTSKVSIELPSPRLGHFREQRIKSNAQLTVESVYCGQQPEWKIGLIALASQYRGVEDTGAFSPFADSDPSTSSADHKAFLLGVNSFALAETVCGFSILQRTT